MPEAEWKGKIGTKMDKTVIIVCAVVGSLGVLSAILGFSAEGTKLTVFDIMAYGDECIYPQNPAIGLGVSAAVFLLAAQVTFSAVGGCCGFCKSRSIPSETKRVVGVVCAVLSWVAAVIAWALLIEGASWNATMVRAMTASGGCYILKDGIFAGGAVLTLAATALAITSFVVLRRQPLASADAEAPAVAATGQPQFQPAAAANKVGEQPLLARASKSQVSPPQGSGHHAAEGNGISATNQQFPSQGCPASAAPPGVASAALEPGEQAPPVGVATDRPQAPLPQANNNGQNGTPPQYTAPAPPQVCVEMPMPVPVPPAAPTQGNGLPAVIRNELTRATIKIVGEAVGNALFSNSDAATPATAAGDILLSVVTDSATGGNVQATN